MKGGIRWNLRISDFKYFAFLIDIIDNIITYRPYSPYYVTLTSANDNTVSLSRSTDYNHVTALPLAEVLVT